MAADVEKYIKDESIKVKKEGDLVQLVTFMNNILLN